MTTARTRNGRLGSAATVLLVARREVSTRLRARSYVLSTLLLVLVVVGMTIGASTLQEEEHHVVAATPEAAGYFEAVRATAQETGTDVDHRDVSTRGQAEERVREGEIDALLTGGPHEREIVVAGELSPDLRALLDGTVRQERLAAELAGTNADSEAVQDALSAPVKTRDLGAGDSAVSERLVLSMIAVGMLYVFLVVFGIYVAQGVVEEKATRMVELLLSTVRPWQLMAGKVLGIGAVGVLQFAAIVVAALGSLAATGQLGAVPDTTSGAAASALLWFVLGYLLFGTLLGASGALVSRQEDVQPVVQPVMALLAVPFVVGVMLVTRAPHNPGTAVELLSLVPLFSPVLMPLRSALGEVPAWQSVLSVGLTAVVLAVCVALAARVYANAILRTGGRVRALEALRAR
ncbi:ABC-2 type transport system permease protein [Lipingzhangella halophila]|uniref:ABC-2 type transport system permease protein n=1 Tax=Lipingzhangella halophila TaxID=1783352 RepID=A0A7W7RIA1_9ACTN|nr:ABC transporter permease [Lipingzhangella halophila]MBB4932405.1 ABC-2 type transport system permease protein [Lipingzhangella halophila]